MSAEESIYDYLIADSGFSTLVDSDSLGWVSVDQESNYPKCVYNIISRPKIVYASDEWQRWRFYVSSDNRFECRSVMDSLTDLLNNIYGDVEGQYFDYISKINEGEIILRDDNIFEGYADFRIKYH